MSVLRLCLKDKSSVVIEANFEDINYQAKNGQYIKVINFKTRKSEMYNKDYIWCIRESSEGDK